MYSLNINSIIVYVTKAFLVIEIIIINHYYFINFLKINYTVKQISRTMAAAAEHENARVVGDVNIYNTFEWTVTTN